MVTILCAFALAFALGGACSLDSEEAGSDATMTRQISVGQSITFISKQSITDFTGYGQHLQYWPLFGASSGITARRTDDDLCIELTPQFSNFKHHYLLEGRTFSNDALGVPFGTKTRGGYSDWAMFTLPDGTVGRSGTFYDESNIDNSNNTVNQIRLNTNSLSDFCLNLITDNTAGEHNADLRFEARSDNVNLNIAGLPEFGFDGQTDMYTFRYHGMKDNDVIKIRLQCSSASGCQGAGLGGILVSDISTCTDAPPMIVDAGPVDASTDATDVDVVLDADADLETNAGDAGDVGEDNADSADSGCGCQSGGDSQALGVFFLFLLLWHMRRRSHA